jgi:hypothetical protein
MGHLPPKNDRKGDDLLRPLNLVVLVVTLLLDGENFLVCEKDVFVPVLSVPLEEMLCFCPSNFLQSRSKEVSL